MSDSNRCFRYRAFGCVVRAFSIASLFLVMTALYRQDDEPGSHYIHPMRDMQ